MPPVLTPPSLPCVLPRRVFLALMNAPGPYPGARKFHCGRHLFWGDYRLRAAINAASRTVHSCLGVSHAARDTPRQRQDRRSGCRCASVPLQQLALLSRPESFRMITSLRATLSRDSAATFRVRLTFSVANSSTRRRSDALRPLYLAFH